MSTLQTVFFTYASRNYEMFVLPYIYSVLFHNDDAAVEICVESAVDFQERNREALDLIGQAFGPGRYLIRDSELFHRGRPIRPHSVRFLETPRTQLEFTYIGDIDILVLEGSITAQHLDNMKKLDLPYSNIVRKDPDPTRRRLTGCHFTRSDAYYPQVDVSDLNILEYGAEDLLYQLVFRKVGRAPASDATFRPWHGLHVSERLNFYMARTAGSQYGLNEEKYASSYIRMRSTETWRRLAAKFDPAYRSWLDLMDSAVQRLYPDQPVFCAKAHGVEGRASEIDIIPGPRRAYAFQSYTRGLSSFVDRAAVRSITDLGCGDPFLSLLSAGAVDLYVGYDISEAQISRNSVAYLSPKHLFKQTDITIASLPHVDLALARDTLNFMRDDGIREVLKRVKESGTKYLALTTYGEQRQERQVYPDGYRIIDWSAFDLPSPDEVFGDIVGEYLTDFPGEAAIARPELPEWMLRRDRSIAIWDLRRLSSSISKDHVGEPMSSKSHMDSVRASVSLKSTQLIDRLEAVVASADEELRYPLRKASECIDFQKYDELLSKYGDAAAKAPPASRYKYLDLPTWLAYKAQPLKGLSLVNCAPKTILDIGSGPAHFAYLASLCGHKVFVNDLEDGMPLYADLVDLFGLEARYFRISPRQPLPELGIKFDLITGLWLSFHTKDGGRSPWSAEDWAFLMEDLRSRFLLPGGRIYFELNEFVDPVTGASRFEPTVFDYFEGIGAQVDRKSGSVSLTEGRQAPAQSASKASSLKSKALGRTYSIRQGDKTFRSESYGNGRYIEQLADILEQHCGAAKSILEWGGGMSSLLFYDFAMKNGADAYLVMETEAAWLQCIQDNIRDTFGSVSPICQFQWMDQVGSCSSWDDPGLNYSTYPLSVGRTFDLIYIDGRRRMECALMAAILSHSETVVIQHDFRRSRYQPSLVLFEPFHDGEQFRVSKVRPEVLRAFSAERQYVFDYISGRSKKSPVVAS